MKGGDVMIGHCQECGYYGPHDYCPLCGEWFCCECWGSCENKDCTSCIAAISPRMT